MSQPQNWQQVLARVRKEYDELLSRQLVPIVAQLNQAIQGLSAQDMQNLYALSMLQDLMSATIYLLIHKGYFTASEMEEACQKLTLVKSLDQLFHLLRQSKDGEPEDLDLDSEELDEDVRIFEALS